jgi:hypothetical protein
MAPGGVSACAPPAKLAKRADFGGLLVCRRRRRRMRYWLWLSGLLCLVACSGDPDAAKLTLSNSVWDSVSVQVVITRSADCDNRGPEFVSSDEFVVARDKTRAVTAPSGTSVCFRHSRNPNNPVPGQWSGWSRAILFPGEDTKTEL